jgi:putative oxidoreductase
LRRLFSTFAPGWPGAGLLLMRLVAGFCLVIHGLERLLAGPSFHFSVFAVSAITIGMLLLAGLWTPFAGSLAVALATWNIIVTRPRDPSACILMATIGAALALIGPGAWSVDAQLFGWKRIDVHDRKS